MVKNWQVLKSRKKGNYKIFTLWEEMAKNPRNGAVRNIVILDFPGWISVIPLTSNNEVVMVRQYRHGVKKVLLEIPGGIMDKEDSSPEIAARRELAEETGYGTDKLKLIGSLYPQPAIQTNRYHIFLAEDVKKIGGTDFDEGEDIETVIVPLKHIPHMIETGKICHAMVVTAFYYLALRMKTLYP